ncbi:hypothetical protein PILCRDRAFT_824133 [Piloderma croceum F 1598]|uniref:Uncharacterized protein n=1 Tax=Piloderma croceum (strain F 1598) TaxID=765440 RepID=A0A0C3FFD4_PILCF|nr:hypothetical protein PILCRDRAFT_824133 [Piloderma croceum F 1598]
MRGSEPDILRVALRPRNVERVLTNISIPASYQPSHHISHLPPSSERATTALAVADENVTKDADFKNCKTNFWVLSFVLEVLFLFLPFPLGLWYSMVDIGNCLSPIYTASLNFLFLGMG